MKMTKELEKRIDRSVLRHACDECYGYGVVQQSPSNPTGSICEPCEGDGWVRDGGTVNDVLQSVKRALDEYIAEFGEKK